MIGGCHKTQGFPKEQPLGQQPYHQSWMSWLVTYLALTICDSPVVTQHKHLGSALASPRCVRHCAPVSSCRVLLELCDSKRIKAASPKSYHRIQTSFPLAAHPCHSVVRSRLGDQDALPCGCHCRGAGSEVLQGALNGPLVRWQVMLVTNVCHWWVHAFLTCFNFSSWAFNCQREV